MPVMEKRTMELNETDRTPSEDIFVGEALVGLCCLFDVLLVARFRELVQGLAKHVLQRMLWGKEGCLDFAFHFL